MMSDRETPYERSSSTSATSSIRTETTSTSGSGVTSLAHATTNRREGNSLDHQLKGANVIQGDIDPLPTSSNQVDTTSFYSVNQQRVGGGLIDDIFHVLSNVELHATTASPSASVDPPYNIERLLGIQVKEEPGQESKDRGHAMLTIDAKGKQPLATHRQLSMSSNPHERGAKRHNEQRRRERISAKLKALEELLPPSDIRLIQFMYLDKCSRSEASESPTVRDQATILDDTMKRIKYLKHQIDMMYMMWTAKWNQAKVPYTPMTMDPAQYQTMGPAQHQTMGSANYEFSNPPNFWSPQLFPPIPASVMLPFLRLQHDRHSSPSTSDEEREPRVKRRSSQPPSSQ